MKPGCISCGSKYAAYGGKYCSACVPADFWSHPEPSAAAFDTGAMYKAAGPSSEAAAAAAESARLNDTHRRIYRLLRVKPMTADEVAEAMELVTNTARARISELKSAGWLRATGETRPTAAGKPADVWCVVEVRERAA